MKKLSFFVFAAALTVATSCRNNATTEAPAESTPAATEQPAQEAPAQEAPAAETPATETPAAEQK